MTYLQPYECLRCSKASENLLDTNPYALEYYPMICNVKISRVTGECFLAKYHLQVLFPLTNCFILSHISVFLGQEEKKKKAMVIHIFHF